MSPLHLHRCSGSLPLPSSAAPLPTSWPARRRYVDMAPSHTWGGEERPQVNGWRSPDSATYLLSIFAICLDFFRGKKMGAKHRIREESGDLRGWGGGLNTCSKADVISAEKKEDHARSLITGTKPSPTHATMNVNALAASRNCPAYAEWKLGWTALANGR